MSKNSNISAGSRSRRKPAAIPAPVVDPLVVGATKFAELMGIHTGTVKQWILAGMPATRGGAVVRIDLNVALKWVRLRHERELSEIRERTDAEGGKERKTAAEARLKEMDVAEREGQLVRASEVEERWAQIINALRESVMAVAGNAVQAGLIEPRQEVELDELHRGALAAAVSGIVERIDTEEEET